MLLNIQFKVKHVSGIHNVQSRLFLPTAMESLQDRFFSEADAHPFTNTHIIFADDLQLRSKVPFLKLYFVRPHQRLYVPAVDAFKVGHSSNFLYQGFAEKYF